MTPPLIRNAEARRLFLDRQGLCFPPRRKLTDRDLLSLIEHLGYVQMDSIDTVARAHHLILFSRNQTYRPGQLKSLLEREAALFENWTHDAAIIPTRFYPFWRPRFDRERQRLRERWRRWRRDGFEDMLDGVLAQIQERGPTMARQLGDGERKNAGGWWDWHPSKTALEYLWRTGALAVARRDGFQKVYDLTERVIPGAYRGDEPTAEALVDWACRSALERLGLATAGELAAFWGSVTPAEAAAWCRAQLGRGVIEALVESADGSRPKPVYGPADLDRRRGAIPAPPGRVRVLSPFDPLIRDRNRTERLFGFRYRIEVFVPAAKRRYGYYVFPLLEGDRFVGRIDMKRRDAALAVSGLWPEPGVRWTRGRQAGLEAELDRLRRFIGAERVAFEDGHIKPADG